MTLYRYLPYTLTLNSSAVITSLGGDPNSSLTLPFIPGASVRGAVARALGDPGADVLRQEVFRDLVLGGRVCYLNAYPSLNGRRALPIPVSLRRKKDKIVNRKDEWLEALDLAAFDGNPTPDKELGESWPQENLASFGQTFLTIGDAEPMLFQPKMSSRIHHQRDRQKGRAWKRPDGEAQGTIFAFESLDAGQTFQGIIQLRAETEEKLDAIEDRLKTLLGNTILVGRSRRGGYGGLAEIRWENSRSREIEGSGTEGLRPVNHHLSQGAQFRLLLTSPCIARHKKTGQIDPTALIDLIEQSLGGRVRFVRKRWAFELVGGFNRKWRLEVPQALAVSAGSVLLFEAKEHIPLEDLCRVEHEGLGEHKEEGYGRVLFLDAPMPCLSLRIPEDTKRSEKVSEVPPPLVMEIERRVMQSHIARKIEKVASDFAEFAQNLPSNSLIGRLRTPLRGNAEEAISMLKAWLSENETDPKRLKQPAMEQLKRCELHDGTNLAQWIRRAMEPGEVLSWLTVDVLAQHHHVASQKSARDFLEKTSPEISVRLIDAVLAALAVRSKLKEDGHE